MAKEDRKARRQATRQTNKGNRKSTRKANMADRRGERQDKRTLNKAVRKNKRQIRKRDRDRDARQILLNQEFSRGQRLYGSGANEILRKLQPGGAAGNPYAMPTSAATSGYTSNMSGMAGAQQAQMQLAQLQQEIMQTQQQRAEQARQNEAAEQQQFQQQMQQGLGELADEEVAGQVKTQLANRAARRTATKLAKTAGAKGANAIQVAAGTANAAQVAESSKNVGDLLGNLSAFGTQSQTLGEAAAAADAAKTAGTAASSGIGAGPIAAAAALAGKGVERLSDDDDDTRTNFGEGAGRLVSGAGSGVGMAAMLGLGPVGLVGAGLVGGYMALRNQRKKKLEAREEAKRQAAQDAQIASAEDAAFKQSMLTTGQDMGYNIGNSMTNSYLPGYQMKAGGKKMNINPKYLAGSKDSGRRAQLIRQIADIYKKGKPYPKNLDKLMKERDSLQAGGQYDPATEAYLDRVDPNRLGMGIKPDYTPETMILGAGTAGRALLNTAAPKILNPAFRGAMPGKTRALATQLEPKIMTDMAVSLGTMAPSMASKKENKQAGGYMKPLPGGAVEFVGPKHSQGGIMLDPQTEVEGGETMDKVKMRENGGKAGDYIFSDFLKLGKKTFAQRHKEMLSRGATQGDIQKLAKMQEEVAKREGRDENGPRGPERIMKAGGVKKHQSGDEITGVIPSPDALDQYELDPDSAYARDFPEGQSKTDEGLYRRADGDQVTMAEVDALKMNNPWYDFEAEGFDPTDPESVEKFQKAYNDRVPESAQIKVDGKVGEQTVSAYIPYKRKEAEVQEETPVETPEETPEETPQETPVGPGMNLRKDILLPYQLIGPMAELTTKYPQPNKVAAPVTGRIKLPRMNMNAERASLAASTNAANKFIQNQSAGPAAIAAQMAMGEKQRQGNIDIATQEARQNKELASTEALANLRASQFDATNVAQARQFNALAQNQRDQNEYEKRMLAFNQLGTNLAQYANDLRSYKTEDRIAEASQIAGEYTRQKYLEELRRQAKRKKSDYYGMNDTQLREIAAQMVQGAPTYNQQDQQRVQAVVGAANAIQGNTQQPEQQKRGGYLRKMGKIKRRRK